MPYPTIPYLALMPYPTIPYIALMSYPTIPYLFLIPYPTIPYIAIPNYTVPGPNGELVNGHITQLYLMLYDATLTKRKTKSLLTIRANQYSDTLSKYYPVSY